MTNETLHTLETRRSCRAYKPEQITKEAVSYTHLTLPTICSV